MGLFFQDNLGDELCIWFHRELRGTLGRAWFWSHVDLGFPTSIELGYVASVALSLLTSETGLIIFEPPRRGLGWTYQGPVAGLHAGWNTQGLLGRSLLPVVKCSPRGLAPMPFPLPWRVRADPVGKLVCPCGSPRGRRCRSCRVRAGGCCPLAWLGKPGPSPAAAGAQCG